MKTYTKPTTLVVKIQQMQMLCASDTTILDIYNGEGNDVSTPSEAWTREFEAWDEW